MGGKWTTYRRMAQDLVDDIAKDAKKRYEIPFIETRTKNLPLIGAHYSDKQRKDLHEDVWAPLVDHLFSNYGGLATEILKGSTHVLDP
jgi:glycerol-3-phosphate dehydrogenase